MEWMKQFEGIDQGANYFFRDQVRRPWLDPGMAHLTHVGDSIVVIVVGLLGVAAFLAIRRPWAALAILLSGCLGIGISEATKRLVNRDRPAPAANAVIATPISKSFPSGHALGTSAVYGAIALALSRRFSNRSVRGLVIAAGFLLAFLIGVTRLYLGVHFVFDVVGGWTAGTACALLGHWVELRFAPDKGLEGIGVAGSQAQARTA